MCGYLLSLIFGMHKNTSLFSWRVPRKRQRMIILFRISLPVFCCLHCFLISDFTHNKVSLSYFLHVTPNATFLQSNPPIYLHNLHHLPLLQCFHFFTYTDLLFTYNTSLQELINSPIHANQVLSRSLTVHSSRHDTQRRRFLPPRHEHSIFKDEMNLRLSANNYFSSFILKHRHKRKTDNK